MLPVSKETVETKYGEKNNHYRYFQKPGSDAHSAVWAASLLKERGSPQICAPGNCDDTARTDDEDYGDDDGDDDDDGGAGLCHTSSNF